MLKLEQVDWLFHRLHADLHFSYQLSGYCLLILIRFYWNLCAPRELTPRSEPSPFGLCMFPWVVFLLSNYYMKHTNKRVCTIVRFRIWGINDTSRCIMQMIMLKGIFLIFQVHWLVHVIMEPTSFDFMDGWTPLIKTVVMLTNHPWYLKVLVKTHIIHYDIIYTIWLGRACR